MLRKYRTPSHAQLVRKNTSFLASVQKSRLFGSNNSQKVTHGRTWSKPEYINPGKLADKNENLRCISNSEKMLTRIICLSRFQSV